jgi:hypothetical protein
VEREVVDIMRWQSIVLSLVPAFLLLGLVGAVIAGEKIALGHIENVLLLPSGVKLPARIDTGSALCALDARELKVRNDVAEFKLPDAYGGLQMRLPVVRWGKIRSANSWQKRAVVEIEICLGPRKIRVEANLVDRSQVKYPVLIGRNALRQGFVVDVSKANIAPPEHREPLTP